jgi:hypothetical protein
MTDEPVAPRFYWIKDGKRVYPKATAYIVPEGIELVPHDRCRPILLEAVIRQQAGPGEILPRD